MLAAGKSEFGVCGVVGGMMVIELLAGKMRLDRDRIAAVGCSSMGGGKHWWEKILWQFTVAIKSDPVAPHPSNLKACG